MNRRLFLLRLKIQKYLGSRSGVAAATLLLLTALVLALTSSLNILPSVDPTRLTSSSLATTGGKRRLQVIKAGGIPKEGFGSSLGFILATANIAYLLDADLYISQTATFFDYRASDYLNKGIEIQPNARFCDIIEILELDPAAGQFQERIDRSLTRLDQLYHETEQKCRNRDDRQVFSDYALKEMESCDVIIINDYRVISRGWTPCSQNWWKSVIDKYSAPAHGNDIAIHFRWGDMAYKAKTEAKWKMDMTKVAPLVDIIREVNPSVQVRVFMAKSDANESQDELREILKPLSGEFEIVEAGDDIEELSMMGKARYLFVNSGSFSIAAAATRAAGVVIHNEGGARGSLEVGLQLDQVFGYDTLDPLVFREAVRP
jgi:hypothetical protein